MSSRTLINLILLLGVAALAAISLFEPGIEKPSAPLTLTDLDPNSIRMVTIRREGQPDILLEKDADRWQLREPLQLPGNTFKVTALLEVLTTESHSRLPATDLELQNFSLKPPRVSLTLDGLHLEFGDTAPLSGNRYVRLGDTVHLISDTFFYHLIAAPADFVHYGLLGPEAKPTTIALSQTTLHLEEGKWIPHPEVGGIDADAISRLTTAWRNARAVSVKAYTEGQAEQEVNISLEGVEQPLHFLIRTGERETIFARPDAGVQYHLPNESATRLLRLENDQTPQHPSQGSKE
ncbi:MAG: DUF4340 domain-containing protein [Gammaproteobacteria bacterium]|nr:DUF4340 domain-containing protein [Gammaproteobacteria bacterium]